MVAPHLRDILRLLAGDVVAALSGQTLGAGRSMMVTKKPTHPLESGSERLLVTERPLILLGAWGRTRTGTALRPRDFKSLASTRSATQAY